MIANTFYDYFVAMLFTLSFVFYNRHSLIKTVQCALIL